MEARPDQLVVLLIDSDEIFRNGLAENLRDDGHEVQEYTRPEETPEAPAFERINAVVIGHQATQREALAFADQFHTRYPAVPIVMVMAYSTGDAEADLGRRDFLNLRSKPIDYDELHALLHATVHTHQA